MSQSWEPCLAVLEFDMDMGTGMDHARLQGHFRPRLDAGEAPAGRLRVSCPSALSPTPEVTAGREMWGAVWRRRTWASRK